MKRRTLYPTKRGAVELDEATEKLLNLLARMHAEQVLKIAAARQASKTKAA
jgi:hypothetical protein